MEEQDFPVWAERTLVALATIMSAVLALSIGLQRWLDKRLWAEVIIVGISASSCIITAFFGFGFYIVGKLSQDAFGIILTGLIPAVQSATRVRLSTLRARLLMRRKGALHDKIADFCYLRHGKSPPPDVQAVLCKKLKATTYLRYPASANISRMCPEVQMWHAKIMRSSDNIIHLKDLNDVGDPVKWWKRANSADDIVRSPSRAQMSKHEQVTNALNLVAEIAMIGDSVLECHANRLINHAQNSNRLTRALSATPVSVCNTFLTEVGLLEEWGPIDERLRDEFTTNFHKMCRAKKYGMLFFILLVESELFHDMHKPKPQHVREANADNVIKTFTETNEIKVRKFITDAWLRRYISGEDRLAKYNPKQDADARAPPPDRPSVIYALIPLHPEVSVTQETKKFSLAVRRIRSVIQNGAIPPGAGVPVATLSAQGSHSDLDNSICLLPNGLPSEIRVVMPIAVGDRPGQNGGEGHDGGGTAGDHSVQVGNSDSGNASGQPSPLATSTSAATLSHNPTSRNRSSRAISGTGVTVDGPNTAPHEQVINAVVSTVGPGAATDPAPCVILDMGS
ncbi:unnamed protein product [Chondrus crispus]|uniref:Uncharacterized protein n=1 Tax=Chondrus crispus TaxID=2769 RepID=R7QEP9_CHOCR|nr:unnamed protein product [Chondrus crispus]CDF36263.1 unnamed protein product [Chondrus crispus]|eukprot:XP_005716082.1 unnamed protein product [Chondrus crispus]